MKKNYTILISGATATGKSSFALDLAKQISGEIINADIGSFYEPLTIGVAKPDWKKESIPHHMFDILKNPELYSVVKFRKKLQTLLKEIWSRGNIPIIVGGSAFYIKAFFYQQHEIPNVEIIAQKLDGSTTSSNDLWKKLQAIDEQRAQAINPNDRYRIVRALSIFEVTGQKPSDFEQVFSPLSPFYFITCDRNRQELYQRIDDRVIEMIASGWIEEVKALLGTPWEPFLMHKKMIGYDDLLLVLKNNELIENVIPIIQQKTRNYAKRQVTFLKKLQKDLIDCNLSKNIEQINLTLCDVGLYIKQLVSQKLKIFG